MVHKEAKYLFIVRVDVDPKDEERFNEWYNTEHIPTMTKVPGVLGANRYCSVDGSRAREFIRYCSHSYLRDHSLLLSSTWFLPVI